MSVGATFDFNLTRDGIVKNAYEKVGNSNPDTPQMRSGVSLLGLIMRELDPQLDILWAVVNVPATIILVANKFSYTSAGGLATNILRLETMNYRNSFGSDIPLIISTNKRYEAITDKFQLGDPQLIYLTEERDISIRKLFVVPMLSSVNSQSEVIGTDALNYRCIYSHKADSTNKPITGANHLLYWEQAGVSGLPWVDGTSYTAPQQLRYTYRKPLWDFDLGRDNPDVPQSWVRMLTFKLASDLGDTKGSDVQERLLYANKSVEAKRAIAPTTVKTTNDFQNKIEFF